MLIGCSSYAHRMLNGTLSLPSRESKLLLKLVLKLIEDEVVERDRGESDGADDGFVPVGQQIEGSDGGHHDDEREDVCEENGSPGEVFSHLDLHAVAGNHGLHHERIHLFGLALGGGTHGFRLACRARRRLHNLNVRHLVVRAKHNPFVSDQFVHKSTKSAQRYKKFFIYASVREHYYKKSVFFQQKDKKNKIYFLKSNICCIFAR